MYTTGITHDDHNRGILMCLKCKPQINYNLQCFDLKLGHRQLLLQLTSFAPRVVNYTPREYG